jgi:hypothetical protein
VGQGDVRPSVPRNAEECPRPRCDRKALSDSAARALTSEHLNLTERSPGEVDRLGVVTSRQDESGVLSTKSFDDWLEERDMWRVRKIDPNAHARPLLGQSTDPEFACCDAVARGRP